MLNFLLCSFVLCSLQPLKSGYGAVRCFIERQKTGMGDTNSKYYLYMESGKQFLMAAKKKPGSNGSNYAVSMQKERVGDKGKG